LVHEREKTLEPRGFSGAEEQETRGHGVERPAVADTGKCQRLPDPFDDVVRREAGGLVEQKEKTAAEGVRRSHGSSEVSGSGRTSESSYSMRAPRSYERSGWKKSSGAYRRAQRRPTSRRRYPEARASPAPARSSAASSPRAVKKTRAVLRSGETSTSVIVTVLTSGSCASRRRRLEISARTRSATRWLRRLCSFMTARPQTWMNSFR